MSSALRSPVIPLTASHRGAHYLLDIRPAGKWPAEVFYYAGGVPAIMEEHQGARTWMMTVTGKTLPGREPGRIKENGFMRNVRNESLELIKRYNIHLTRERISSVHMIKPSEPGWKYRHLKGQL